MSTPIFVIITKPGCGFCAQARMLVNARGIDCEIWDKDSTDGVNWTNKAPTNFKTWPKIFKNGTFIGGTTDLRQLLNQ